MVFCISFQHLFLTILTENLFPETIDGQVVTPMVTITKNSGVWVVCVKCHYGCIV